MPPCPGAGGPEICNDAFDNDDDTFTDCADPDCAADPSCTESICDDFEDNDGDFLVDCADTDCYTDPLCILTCLEDGFLDCGWVETDFDAAGQPGSVVLSGGVARFDKTGETAALTKAIGMAVGGTDNRPPVPWSVEVTMPDVSEFPEAGGHLMFRFHLQSGVVVHDWLSLGRLGGGINLNTAQGSPVVSFSAAAITSLTLKFDVEVSGLTVSAATDGGAFGAGVDLEWLGPGTVEEFTKLGVAIGGMDLFGVTSGPFSITIDDLQLTSVIQP